MVKKSQAQCPFAPDLISVIKYDKNIDAKCKAIKSLGDVHDIEIAMAYNFLKKITTQKGYEPEVYKPAVQKEAKTVIGSLKSRIISMPNYDSRPELQKLVSE